MYPAVNRYYVVQLGVYRSRCRTVQTVFAIRTHRATDKNWSWFAALPYRLTAERNRAPDIYFHGIEWLLERPHGGDNLGQLLRDYG